MGNGIILSVVERGLKPSGTRPWVRGRGCEPAVMESVGTSPSWTRGLDGRLRALFDRAVSHMLEAGDTFRHRRMSAEEASDSAGAQRIDDEHMRRRGAGVHRNAL